ncbi:MAG: hypothetical protein FWG66_16085 [Spirochaetes bacterium]|nr:hypothetical protein [Spirochaetota bacterium]
MNLDKIFSNKRALYAGLVLVAFSLVFTSTLRPFSNRIMNVDTSVYVSITQGLSRGLVLYSELADNKGPLLYFISLPGFHLAGITGVWVTQFVLMFVSIFFMYKLALLFVSAKAAFLTVAFTSLAMHPFYYVDAGAEEYALPFLAVSLYIFTKHYIGGKDAGFWEVVVLGASFALAIMIRLNMFPLWAGFCLVIIIEALSQKRFADMFKYIGAFLVGVFAVLLPIFLYLWRHDIFLDFYYNVVVSGAARGFAVLSLNEFIHNFYTIINRSFSFIPLCIGVVWVFVKYKNISVFYFAGFLLSYFLSILFLSFSRGEPHWNLILIPFFVPAVAFLSDLFLNNVKVKYKHAALIILFCVAFSEGLARLSSYLFFPHDTGIPIRDAGRIIDENTAPNDTIISLGAHAYIYPFTQRLPASRFIIQGWAFDHIPGAREEFVSGILNDPPKIIAIVLNENGMPHMIDHRWHGEIFAMMESDYRLLEDNGRARIFIREDAAPGAGALEN